jgi:hypothetical protein
VAGGRHMAAGWGMTYQRSFAQAVDAELCCDGDRS